ncbi:MAG: GNAT family N-acetyltransferase [Candidatus Hydrogenedentes bacterium]|nr:GNAT family N-acetyltransferase [Candidatus Hydrogenedentota bacterium]
MELQLRRPERADLDVLVDWMGDAEFRRFLFGDNEDKALPIGQQMMGVMSSGLALPMGTIGHLLIEEVATGPVGIVIVQELSWRNRGCFAAVYLAAPVRNAGTVEAAMRCVMTYCFDEMNLHRAGVKVEAGQADYVRACERLGFAREFTMPNHVLRDGKGVDVYGFAMLRREYDALRAAGAGA